MGGQFVGGCIASIVIAASRDRRGAVDCGITHSVGRLETSHQPAFPKCSRPCQLRGWEVRGSREETCAAPEALTSSRRLVPPSFDVRRCYILRRDRSLRGSPRPKRNGHHGRCRPKRCVAHDHLTEETRGGETPIPSRGRPNDASRNCPRIDDRPRGHPVISPEIGSASSHGPAPRGTLTPTHART